MPRTSHLLVDSLLDKSTWHNYEKLSCHIIMSTSYVDLSVLNYNDSSHVILLIKQV